eukprot:9450698-Pyramimonas_sp.AAC.1
MSRTAPSASPLLWDSPTADSSVMAVTPFSLSRTIAAAVRGRMGSSWSDFKYIFAWPICTQSLTNVSTLEGCVSPLLGSTSLEVHRVAESRTTRIGEEPSSPSSLPPKYA